MKQIPLDVSIKGNDLQTDAYENFVCDLDFVTQSKR